MKKIKKRIFEILEIPKEGDTLSRIFEILLITLIILNIVAIILETEPSLRSHVKFFRYFEIFSVAAFSIEYVLRLWTCNIHEKFAGVISGRIKYVLTPMAIIDLLAILPFYLPAILPVDLRVLRILRLLRIFRILKIARYSKALRSVVHVFRSKKEELVVALSALFMLLVLASTLMYYVEHEAQPDKFQSIFQTMWWGIVTLTTVGYGDAVPVTILGKLLGAVIAILGIGMFALPAAILSSGFMEKMKEEKTQ